MVLSGPFTSPLLTWSDARARRLPTRPRIFVEHSRPRVRPREAKSWKQLVKKHTKNIGVSSVGLPPEWASDELKLKENINHAHYDFRFGCYWVHCSLAGCLLGCKRRAGGSERANGNGSSRSACKSGFRGGPFGAA